ncbi:hypothetical protein E4L96_09250 [Massilia arenosa]|uniref:Acyltransferase 3 domain-containing protein n=1 Tax=Zemynaea arenosa TaxID=2561931 RepID=A0A4Y9SHR4_9BURK|nr:acyltransferase family protein [Massilia arenosa]TFW21264.1 hypothetical protein E4L96_09250 [Massilia arenosa]
MNNNLTNRLYFLDWVRIIAFIILIFYHTGMYYVTWGWHVKSPYASDAIEAMMLMSAPWRLGLLFFISGVASSFLLSKTTIWSFVKQRSKRLLIPLLFGMAVIVPLQPYCEVIEKLHYQGSFIDFLKLYYTGYHGFCENGKCLDLPTWNHLWFVAYLFVYTLAYSALVALAAHRLPRITKVLVQALSGWRLLALPVIWFAVMRMGLKPWFPETHALVNDWYNHAVYFPAFMVGALIAKERLFWQRMDDIRWPALAFAFASWGIMMAVFSLPDPFYEGPNGMLFKFIGRTAWSFCEWCPVIAACGFAHRHLNFESPRRQYLTQAVFPVYILHQTIIVGFAHLIKPAALTPGVEYFVLIGVTFGLCFGSFAIIRRVPLLMPLFGLSAPAKAGNGRATQPAETLSMT